MKGKYHITVQNNRLRYEFDIKRNITIIRGDSATGKTTLVNLIALAAEQGADSGVDVICRKSCRTLPGTDWKLVLSNLRDNIIFLDENSSYIKTQEFAECVRNSDNYFVLVTREDLPNLPYSVDEIYGIHSSGKYLDLKRTFNTFFRIYSPDIPDTAVHPDTVITEDSRTGYQFFEAVCAKNHIECASSGGKSNLREMLSNAGNGMVLGVADGAAIGPEMNELALLMKRSSNIRLYLPESFEWIILKSGLIDGNEIADILSRPEDFADSSEYFSWEQYFVKLLVTYTKDTYLHYSKADLNPVYLHEKNMKALLDVMDGISFESDKPL